MLNNDKEVRDQLIEDRDQLFEDAEFEIDIEHTDGKSSEVYLRIKEQRELRRKKERLIHFSILGLVFTAVIIVCIIIVNVKSNANNIVSENVISEDNGLLSEQSTAETQTVKPVPKLIYPTMGDSYIEITSTAVKSPYVAVLDVENHKIIAGKECDKIIYPASMTKVMTLIVAVENLKSYDQKIVMTSEMIAPLVKQQASRAGFDPGEEVDAMNLLYGLILPSGADAAVGLSNMIAGSETEFVNLMNKKCEELGLKNTHFMNTSGLHDPDHYTTSIEMAMIMEYAMKNEICAKILSTYQYTTTPTPQHPVGIPLTSTMFSRMYGTEVPGMTITAGKTGYTDQSGNCLVSYADKVGRHYVVVLAGESYKWNAIFDDFEVYKYYTP